ncbi:MAG: carboxylate-amine ligase [Thiohalobacterales bacterium]|nr:carboxylate-amine ligase [Thiohalobacterales bacterium]
MTPGRPSFTIGIEEEYLLASRASRDVVIEPPREILEQCQAEAVTGLVEPELLRSQIEVDTRVCETVAEAREDLARLRRTISEVAGGYGMAPIAASTHPFAEWHLQQQTHKTRYDILFRDMQSLARRLLICGMHVHVGIEDDELRVILLNQFRPYLPLLLSLSTSSPFWQGEDSGLKSYRLTVFDNFPRSGLPEKFDSYDDYRHHIAILQQAGVMEDATFIWWDLRISERYPTLETRIADMCTRLDDTAAIAALTQSILHYLYRMQSGGADMPVLSRFLVDQNRWRAMRYGYDEGLIDFNAARVVPVSDLLADLVETVRPDAEALGCSRELEQALEIPVRGSSAHSQLAIYQAALGEGLEPTEALNRVVDWLVEETVRGL